jgi:hypothetical protein
VASCPWSELFLGELFPGANYPWGKLSMGRIVHSSAFMGRVVTDHHTREMEKSATLVLRYYLSNPDFEDCDERLC